jgi:hypothetical protein
MIFTCPRCRLPLDADVPRGRATRVTCPACLELITVHPPAPIPALPVMAGDHALDYRALGGDVEQELQRDMRTTIWGIGVFAVAAVVGYFMLKVKVGMPGETTYWLGWIGVVTAFLATVMFTRHARHGRNVRAGAPVRIKGTGERVASVVALGITGLLLVILTILAAVILVFAACFAMRII